MNTTSSVHNAKNVVVLKSVNIIVSVQRAKNVVAAKFASMDAYVLAAKSVTLVTHSASISDGATTVQYADRQGPISITKDQQ